MKHITNLSDFYKTDEWETFLRILADERANEDGEIICAHCGKPIVRKYDRIGHPVEHLTFANVTPERKDYIMDSLVCDAAEF